MVPTTGQGRGGHVKGGEGFVGQQHEKKCVRERPPVQTLGCGRIGIKQKSTFERKMERTGREVEGGER